MALSAIVALAAMVRCQNLAALSYDFDEAFCWKMIGFPVGEIWTRSALDNHPPLYFYLLWGWARVFGDSPQALRSLSVLLGLATVVGAYFLVRQIGSGIRENSGDGNSGIRENSGDGSGWHGRETKPEREGGRHKAETAKTKDLRPKTFPPNPKSKIENPKSVSRPHPGPLVCGP